MSWTRPDDRPPKRADRKIVVVISALFVFEAAIYSTITPLLPHYARVLGASKPAIGLLTASYPAGMIVGALLGGWLAACFGVRRTTLIGLLVFAGSIAGFGFGSNIFVLDSLRLVQGIACGCLWGGGLTWVIAVARPERRGELIGSVIGAAIFGTLLGPIVGTLAVAAGTRTVFICLGALSLGLAAWVLRRAEPPRQEVGARGSLRRLIGAPGIRLGAWLILLAACTFGAVITLLPLRLAGLGASGIGIGTTFVIASLFSTIVAAPIGRAVDRRGPVPLLCASLAITAVLLAVLPLPGSALGLAVITVIAVGGPLTGCAIPAMSILTDAAERSAASVAIATMVLNLAWATGETVGAPTAAAVAHATSDAVPLLLLAAVMVVTLRAVYRSQPTAPRGLAPPAGAESTTKVRGAEEVQMQMGQRAV